MCLAIPMQVLRMEGGLAVCESRDGVVRLDTLLTGPLQAGQWVLGFLGAAREVIDAERAGQVANALDTLAALMQGASGDDALIAAGFADLVGREPQLPEFLRPRQGIES